MKHSSSTPWQSVADMLSSAAMYGSEHASLDGGEHGRKVAQELRLLKDTEARQLFAAVSHDAGHLQQEVNVRLGVHPAPSQLRP